MYDAHPAKDRTIAMIAVVRHILSIFIVSAIYILPFVRMSRRRIAYGLFEVLVHFRWNNNYSGLFFYKLFLEKTFLISEIHFYEGKSGNTIHFSRGKLGCSLQFSRGKSEYLQHATAFPLCTDFKFNKRNTYISNMRPLGNFKIKFGETSALMNESLSPKAYGIFCIYVVIRVAWSQK